jgi:predicted nucleic acid-binding Zn ribbon protein
MSERGVCGVVNKGQSYKGRRHTGPSLREHDRSKGRYTTVGRVLTDYIEKHPEFRYQVKVREALPAWYRIADTYTTRHTEAVMVKDRTLFVNTDSSALASELSLRVNELLKRINRELGTPILEHIVFKSGRVVSGENGDTDTASRGETHPRGPGPGDVPQAPRLSAGVMKRIDSMVAAIHEEELREIMRRFLHAAAWRNRPGSLETGPCNRG